MIVSMKNDAGLVREVKVGFCWTAFFFGPLPFFFRGMPGTGFLWCCLPFIANFVLPFRMNKYTAHHYLENGYKPVGSGWEVAGPLWSVAAPSTDQNFTPLTNVYGGGETQVSTPSKFKTWHKVTLGILLIAAIFGQRHHGTAEKAANSNSAASPPMAKQHSSTARDEKVEVAQAQTNSRAVRSNDGDWTNNPAYAQYQRMENRFLSLVSTAQQFGAESNPSCNSAVSDAYGEYQGALDQKLSAARQSGDDNYLSGVLQVNARILEANSSTISMACGL